MLLFWICFLFHNWQSRNSSCSTYSNCPPLWILDHCKKKQTNLCRVIGRQVAQINQRRALHIWPASGPQCPPTTLLERRLKVRPELGFGSKVRRRLHHVNVCEVTRGGWPCMMRLPSACIWTLTRSKGFAKSWPAPPQNRPRAALYAKQYANKRELKLKVLTLFTGL